jgi:hypothetical protein
MVGASAKTAGKHKAWCIRPCSPCVPELAAHSDPVLRSLDPLLDDDPILQQARADLARHCLRYVRAAGMHLDTQRPCKHNRLGTRGRRS